MNLSEVAKKIFIDTWAWVALANEGFAHPRKKGENNSFPDGLSRRKTKKPARKGKVTQGR